MADPSTYTFRGRNIKSGHPEKPLGRRPDGNTFVKFSGESVTESKPTSEVLPTTEVAKNAIQAVGNISESDRKGIERKDLATSVVATMIIEQRSGSGIRFVENNPGGVQTDGDRWPQSSLIDYRYPAVDNAGDRREFAGFGSAERGIRFQSLEWANRLQQTKNELGKYPSSGLNVSNPSDVWIATYIVQWWNGGGTSTPVVKGDYASLVNGNGKKLLDSRNGTETKKQQLQRIYKEADGLTGNVADSKPGYISQLLGYLGIGGGTPKPVTAGGKPLADVVVEIANSFVGAATPTIPPTNKGKTSRLENPQELDKRLYDFMSKHMQWTQGPYCLMFAFSVWMEAYERAGLNPKEVGNLAGDLFADARSFEGRGTLTGCSPCHRFFRARVPKYPVDIILPEDTSTDIVPQKGDIVLLRNLVGSNYVAHHAGIVIDPLPNSPGQFKTVEGNTIGGGYSKSTLMSRLGVNSYRGTWVSTKTRPINKTGVPKAEKPKSFDWKAVAFIHFNDGGRTASSGFTGSSGQQTGTPQVLGQLAQIQITERRKNEFLSIVSAQFTGMLKDISRL